MLTFVNEKKVVLGSPTNSHLLAGRCPGIVKKLDGKGSSRSCFKEWHSHHGKPL